MTYRLYHGAAHLTLRSRKFALLAMANIATGIGEEQKMGSRIGKKERRARRSRRDMARGAKEPQHEMTYSERVKASSKGGSLGKRMNSSKRRQRTPTVSRAPRLCCENDAARKETTAGMLAELRNARLDRSWSNGAWKMQAPKWFLRKYRRHLHHLPDDVRAKLNLR
ncbi:MAG: hypothetical protein ACPGOT_01590 [Candidatus Poseidoniaceae archaeon]